MGQGDSGDRHLSQLVNTDMARAVTAVEPAAMTQPEDLASLSSSLLSIPNAAVPFELAMNCSLET